MSPTLRICRRCGVLTSSIKTQIENVVTDSEGSTVLVPYACIWSRSWLSPVQLLSSRFRPFQVLSSLFSSPGQVLSSFFSPVLLLSSRFSPVQLLSLWFRPFQVLSSLFSPVQFLSFLFQSGSGSFLAVQSSSAFFTNHFWKMNLSVILSFPSGPLSGLIVKILLELSFPSETRGQPQFGFEATS
jgi:hypothetical protein